MVVKGIYMNYCKNLATGMSQLDEAVSTNVNREEYLAQKIRLYSQFLDKVFVL